MKIKIEKRKVSKLYSLQHRKRVLTKFFDIRGYFEILVFEKTTVDSKVSLSARLDWSFQMFPLLEC